MFFYSIETRSKEGGWEGRTGRDILTKGREKSVKISTLDIDNEDLNA